MTIFANCVALAVYTPYPYGDSNLTNQYLVSIFNFFLSVGDFAPLFFFLSANQLSTINNASSKAIRYFRASFLENFNDPRVKQLSSVAPLVSEIADRNVVRIEEFRRS